MTYTYPIISIFNNTIFNNTLINNWRGIYLRESRENSIFNNIVRNNDDGGIILSTSSNYNKVTDNIASNDNEGYDQNYGIWLFRVDYNNITNNLIENNYYHGIFIGDNCDNNSISYNIVNDNSQNGIYLTTNCRNNTITHNEINRNDLGIKLYDSNYNIIF